MFGNQGNTTIAKTTTHKVVLPFYVYASISFLAATLLLVQSSGNFSGTYFQPNILAITHIMALGWGTMIILGASHQLVPVLIEGELHSNRLAYVTFYLAGIGIPFLVYGFYRFNMGAPALLGGGLVVVAVVMYTINLARSIINSKNRNIHALFVFAATLWLLITTSVGFLLLCNFNTPCLPHNSVHYLSLHAHMGIAGWFLLTVIGVGARLIPMFLISKYENNTLLKRIFYLVNVALISFIICFFSTNKAVLLIPILLMVAAITLFVYYCRQAYADRMRKAVDEQMKISLLSVAMILIPLVLILVTIFVFILTSHYSPQLILAYGFFIFFGWITAIILGMTFKTLPFIVWNKTYHQLSGKGKTPNPKDLLSDSTFHWMSRCYIIGFVLFAAGIIMSQLLILKIGAIALLVTAVLYNLNVFKVVLHKPVTDASNRDK